MMGSGKSTVGPLVADRMRRPFFDTDSEIERRTGTTVADIFAARGDAAFRAEERAALCCLLARPVPSVIALGGGAVLDPESRRRLRAQAFVVWLEAAPHVLAGRLGAGEGRPLLGGDPGPSLRRLVARRRLVYSEVADSIVEAGSPRPSAVAEAVLDAVSAHQEADSKGANA